jgi:hypothetical protein
MAFMQALSLDGVKSMRPARHADQVYQGWPLIPHRDCFLNNYTSLKSENKPLFRRGGEFFIRESSLLQKVETFALFSSYNRDPIPI